MKKFRFALEGVARVREIALGERKVELARAQEALKEADHARRTSQEAISMSMQGSPRGTVVRVQQLLERDAELRRLRAELLRKEQTLVKCEEQLGARRSGLMDARRDVKAVEKLRDRRYIEFLGVVSREEQKATDETAARRVRIRKAA